MYIHDVLYNINGFLEPISFGGKGWKSQGSLKVPPTQKINRKKLGIRAGLEGKNRRNEDVFKCGGITAGVACTAATVVAGGSG